MNKAMTATNELNQTIENVPRMSTITETEYVSPYYQASNLYRLLKTMGLHNAPYKDSVIAVKHIIQSVIKSYVGGLESGDNDYGDGIVYWPSDEQEVRDTFLDVWGAFLPADYWDPIVAYLMEGTPNPADWPNAFCPDSAD